MRVFKIITVEGDANNFNMMLISKYTPAWEMTDFITQTKGLLHIVDMYKCQYNYQEGNEAADRLAVMGRFTKTSLL